MWKRKAVAALTATLTLVAIAATPARAQPPANVFYGDLNGDGLTDRVRLGDAGPELCYLDVAMGRPGGGFLPGESHEFGINPGICPDRGTIIDIGGDGTAEIVIVTSHYLGAGRSLWVMRDFSLVDTYAQPFHPANYLATRDFNGDGLGDLYVEGDFGFVTFLNTRGGRPARGPLELPGCYPLPHWEFADFHGGGVLGALVVWNERTCLAPAGQGVAVIRHDGVREYLEVSENFYDSWTPTVLDANSDGRQDVRTEDDGTREITHFISLGNGTFGESPRAVFDRPTVSLNRPTVIDVLANDYVTDQATVTITSQPKFGTVQVNPDRTITYTRLRPHDGGDRFTYLLTQDGKKHRTPVSIRFAS